MGVQDEDDEFVPNANEPILPQIENYANEHKIELPQGWKVNLAKAFKKQTLSKKKKKIPKKYLDIWIKLFKNFV